MVFNSLEFLVFITLFLPAYFLTRGNIRLGVSLAASYIFYGWWDWRFLFLIIGTTVMDFYLGQRMEATMGELPRRRLIAFSVVMNLTSLGFFKYFNFFIDSAQQSLHLLGYHAHFNTLHIILPVGISFYTFQSMSYTIDIYRHEIHAEKHFIRFATFVALFPQLVAGPIVRARDFLPQLQEDYTWDWDRFYSGMTRVVWGFFKKVAVADSLAPFVDLVFNAPHQFNSINLLVALIFYAFQIYCDFSGYSDIAIGLARIMGFTFLENFKTPYGAQNFSVFWQRWHISLSSWLRDYLYIPLGGNRHGALMTYRNNLLTMLIGGLWHGANWAFVFWGLLHGLYLIGQRLLTPAYTRMLYTLKVPERLQRGLNIAIVFALTCFAWIYFRSGAYGSHSFEVANTYIQGLFSLEGWNPATIQNKFWFIKNVFLIIILLFVETTNHYWHYPKRIAQSPAFRMIAYAAVIWLILWMGTFGAKAFIYFQF